MKKTEREDVEEMVSAVARLCLWLVGDIEPESIEIVEIDLDQLERLLVQSEVKLQELRERRESS